MTFPYLTVSIFLPLAAMAIVLCLPSSWKHAIRWVSMAAALATFAIVSLMAWEYGKDNPGATQAKAKLATAQDYFAAKAEGTKLEALRKVGGDDKSPAYAKFVALLARPGNPTTQERAALAASGLDGLFDRGREDALAAACPFAPSIKFVERCTWIEAFNIHYFVGVDGLSLPLIWLSALLTVLCLAYSWTVEKATKGYFALFLLLETALVGVFAALDFFLFYVFWEIVLLPMYFLIGFWGGPRRIYAAIKFFIYTLVGSVLMLIAMIALYLKLDPHSFNVLTLISAIPEMRIDGTYGILGWALSFKQWIFLGLFVAFAIKVPVFPFHTWLPDAHVEAPTAGSVVLAGVLLKMGGYGFFRFSYPLTPVEATSETFVYFIGLLGVINIVYGALCAMAQKDFKSLVAYSSISHMGYVLLGLAAASVAGITGAILQMFTHGLSSAMMFLLVGVIYDRAHHRNLDDFGGIGLKMPYYTGLATVGFFAALGLPGLCGFVSEALVFLGAWHTQGLYMTYGLRWMVLVSLAGVVFGAAYILWTIQRVFMGALPSKYESFADLDAREWFCLAPLGLLCVIVGVFPGIVIDYMDPTIQALFKVLRP